MTLNVHKFAAIKGKQSGDDYFTVVCEMALIPKLFLEIVSLLRYLLLFDMKAFIAQLCSYIWILSHPIYMIKRIHNINQIKIHSLYSILNKMYKSSIVFKYFILRKKKYSELIN